MKKGLMLGLASAAFVAACSADSLTVPNPNSPQLEKAGQDPGAIQFQVTGITRQLRGSAGGLITAAARFGREGYIYTPNEGRNTSHYLVGLPGANRLDPSGFTANVGWGAQYGNLRDIYNFKNAVAAQPATTLNAAQKSAALGFARTIEALELLSVISFKDSLGGVVEILAEPTEVAPFVSRDSVYRYILGTLDQADAELAAGGAAFPFVLHSGFTGFNTPTNLRRVNRAIKARAAVYHATRGGGATAYTQAQAALAASFLNRTAATAAAMDAGPSHPYSTSTGDVTNGVGQNNDFLGHPSNATDIAAGDLRSAKWVVQASRGAPGSPPFGIPTTLRITRYPTNVSSVPIIRNEELLLLDAEVRWFTNADKAGAIANLNQVRATSGGLGASTLTVGSTDTQFIDALLYERRFSLFAEGHRWIDHRRFGRLAALPLDITTGVNTHFVARVIPVVQAECLSRVGTTLPAPGC